MPTATVTTTYTGTGTPVSGQRTLTGSIETIIGPLSVAQGAPNAQTVAITEAGLKALMISSTKNITVTTTNGGTPDVVTVLGGEQYLWVGDAANPFAGGDVTLLTIACTETGLTAVVNIRILHNE